MNLSVEHGSNLYSTKSKLMLFGSKNKVNIVKASLDIKIDNAILPIVDEAKCLGIIFDLTFAQVKKLIAKAYSSSKLIFSNRHILTFNLKRMFCESLVLSHFHYCDFVFGFCLDTKNIRFKNKFTLPHLTISHV